MTIKRQIYYSNIRMILVIILSFILSGFIVAAALHVFEGSLSLKPETITKPERLGALLRLIPLIVFITIASIINNLFTIRLSNKILKPLEPLSEGVRQIQNNNYKYRIEYKNNDEFRPVCEAFNDMAVKLETSSILQKKNEANRKELIAGISHDLRTPLTSIIGCIEGIETGVASTPEMQHKYHTFIKHEAENMRHILEQLFLFSKLDMEEFPFNMMNVDISLAVSEMIEDSVSGYKSRGLSVNLSDLPKNVIVSADVRLLRNVITNILENSVKYKTKEHGHIKISAELIDNEILFRFTDDGPGVEADMLPKLTDVFYRSDPSRSGLGSGLGLAISEKIIQNMKGSIHAELPPAGGLAIIIRLPTVPVPVVSLSLPQGGVMP